MSGTPTPTTADKSRSLLKTEVSKLVNSRIQTDESFASGLHYLQNLLPDNNENVNSSEYKQKQLRPVGEDRKIREKLEQHELDLFKQFADEFSQVNNKVQEFVTKIRVMSDICNSLSERIHSNKEKTRDLLRKTSILQNEKRELQARETYLNDFFEKFSLPTEDDKALQLSSTGVVNDAFFKAFKKLLDIIGNVEKATSVTPDNSALNEMFESLDKKRVAAFNNVFASMQRECRLLNVEVVEVKSTLCQSFEVLQNRPDYFGAALDVYCGARRDFLSHSFIDALTKGRTGEGGAQEPPIEHLSNDPLRYVNDMLAWIHQSLEAEREMVMAVLKACKPDTILGIAKECLSKIADGLTQPLCVRLEHAISREGNCVTLYRLSSLVFFYMKTFELPVGDEAPFIKKMSVMHDLAVKLFFTAVTTNVQRILGNMNVPDYDLLPVGAIDQSLLLLRDILESHSSGSSFTAFMDKKEMYAKIFALVLDPLNQAIQLVSSNLHSHLDVAVYMLNCLHAIKSVVILYQYTDVKLEMIKAQIDANEDVLVSEQASSILTNTGLIDIYSKALNHLPASGPLSQAPGMEAERIAGAIALFNGFLDKPDGFQCHQCAKIASVRSKESVQSRTFDNVVAAYSVIYNKLIDPANGYKWDNISLKTIDQVKEALAKNVSAAP